MERGEADGAPLPYLGYSYHRATQELGERASAYYLGEDSAWPSKGTDQAQPALVGGILNVLLSLVVSIGAVVLLVLADVRLAGSQFPAIVIALIILSTVVGVA